MPNRRELSGGKRDTERGMTLFMVAAGLVVLLGMAALAIDLASLYVGRNEAQRAADAGALGGAKAFVDSGCISGGAGACAATTFTNLANSRAVAAAGQNSVGGVLVSSLSAGCVTATPFNLSGTNPEISVTVARTTACGNAMPTFFARIFSFLSADVSAKATAEAYNGPNICAGCVKPFSMPNCDPLHTLPGNPACATPGQGYFVDPTGAIAHPGPYPTGVVGEQWVLHYNSGPSQYYGVDTGCGTGDQRPCISTCSSAAWACGNTLSTVQGNRAGQIRQGIEDLIHASATGPNHGQDTITINPNGTWTITGGTNNPISAMRGQPITNSDSLVSVALYDGHNVPPGSQTVTIVGYMTMFIESVAGTGSDAAITARVVTVSGCGARTGTCGNSGGGSTGGTVGGGGGSLLPIRLVRTPGT
jgi:hypothetical protein